MELKQAQSDKLFSDEQFKYKIETLTNKLNDSQRQVDSLRGELKNINSLFENEKLKFKEERDKLQKSIG